MPMYSLFGSGVHLPITDEYAEAYNRGADAFQAAQKEHLDRTGNRWTVADQLQLRCSAEDVAAYNSVADLINFLLAREGVDIDIHEDDIESDHLIKL